MASETPEGDVEPVVAIDQQILDRWAEVALRVGHLNTLLQRAMGEGSPERARVLSDRARAALYRLFNELLVVGAKSAATDPEYPYVHWHRGLALEALGRTEEARQKFDAFAQGLAATGRRIPDDVSTAVVEKLRQYELDSLYQPADAKP